MENLAITISREFGSGGRLVGEKLALNLGFLYYDKKLITLASEKSGLSSDYIEQAENRASNSFLYNLSANYAYTANLYSIPNVYFQYDMPIDSKAYLAQVAVIREVAAKQSCVIVGRCANYILRDNPNCYHFFICADKKDRIERAVNLYHVDKAKAEETVVKTDKGRANYYRHHTGEDWSNMHDYALCVNTSVCGIDGAVATIKAYLRENGKI